MNIVLTGFMGTGKSSVGQEVARRLGRPFVDMDAEIEKRAGKTISCIFGEDGEPAFRRIEAQLVRELASEAPWGQGGLVIATGGGAMVDPVNRRRLICSGPVFCLECEVDTILARLARLEDRPLLDVADRRDQIERLLEARREAYGAIPRQIDTTQLSIDAVASLVVNQAFSILLPVRCPSADHPTYEIHIGPGLWGRLGALVAPFCRSGLVAVVTNPTVGDLYLAPMLESLCRIGLTPCACTIPDGEQHKTLDTLASLVGQFVSHGLDRGGLVLALGGGVVCDVAGFAAATYMRGLPVIQVPTTLLAMVDASVGGKTAVDLPQGKNLVGAFKQPALVAIDPDVLQTLPQAEVASGMAELIKHGILADGELFAELASGVARPGGELPWARWIARSLQVKIEVVEQDPFEHGWRAALNLGHTTAHALEQLSGFSLRHGEAVSIGLVVAARIAVELGLTGAALPDQIAAALSAHGLPVACPPFGADEIWQAMHHDKKKRGQMLHWVLPRQIGKVTIDESVPREVVLRALDLSR